MLTWIASTSCLSMPPASRTGSWPSISIPKVPTRPSGVASMSTWRKEFSLGLKERASMRRGILSDEAIKRMFPEHFPPDFRTHQLIYEDGVDVPKHRLTGIKRSKTAHQHLKTKPRYPLHDLFLHSQAVAPLNPSVKSSVGAYRRAIGDALDREGASFSGLH